MANLQMNKLTYLLTGLLVMMTMAVKAQPGSKMEAENATYVQCKLIQDSRYSGGKALELTESEAKITFNYHAAKKGKYTVYVGYDGLYGDKIAVLTVNGSSGNFVTKGLGETSVGTYFMNQGDNSIVVTPSWTWFRIDYIRIAESSSSLTFNISPKPIDAEAADCAQKLYTFLYNNFGKKTISGMMTGDMASANGNITQHDDIKAVYQASGKYPALVGFDFLFSTGSGKDEGWAQDYTKNVMTLAKDVWQRGGIPNFTWHWRDPSRNTWEFYTDKCSVKITDAQHADGSWNTSSQLYKYIISDIDEIADYFLELQKAGIACIFRPLHEPSGGWFWWGRQGAEPFIKLYRLVYDEMVRVKGVHNVIWVFNAGDDDADWDPGLAYYDVISTDIYNANYDYSSNYVLFDKLKTRTEGKKLIALAENGPIPDIDKEFDEEAVWSWWMPWYHTWNGNFVSQTSNAEWKKCMNDSRVITLDDLSAGWGTSTAIRNPQQERRDSLSIYDLKGHRLKEVPSKGLYIRNGKVFRGE